jgi:SAM-dependent methyltransferase
VISNAIFTIRTQGVGGLFHSIRQRVLPDRLSYFSQCVPFVEERIGLEIGGPSSIFAARGILPIYPIATRIDNCNFGDKTIWEGQIQEGDTFQFHTSKAPGRQFVSEGACLPHVRDETYDFVLSSHCLEHLANPLGGLLEWRRVLKPNGLLVLVLPHKDGTFDHLRPVTRLSHLVADLEQNTPESDLTHLGEILEFHDLSKDPGAGSAAEFAERCKDNLQNRCLHHHVFDVRLAVAMVDRADLQIRAVEIFRPYHIVVVAQKPDHQGTVVNIEYLGLTQSPKWVSPFPSDKNQS